MVETKFRPSRRSGVGSRSEISEKTAAISSTSREAEYNTPKQRPNFDIDDDNNDDDFVEEEAHRYVRENVGAIAIPYLIPYPYEKCFVDKQRR